MHDYRPYSSFNGIHSQTSFHTTMTRTGKQDVSETDVSQKKMTNHIALHRYLTMTRQDRLKFGVGTEHYRCHIVCKK